MSIRLSKTQSQLIGAIIAGVIGLGLLIVGGRLIVYDYLLTEPVTISALVIDSGRLNMSRGSNTNFVRYQFIDQFGETQGGLSSGYSEQKGGNILIEYSPRFPSIHRIAGEGKTSGYQWRWFIAGCGLFFLVITKKQASDIARLA